MILSFYIINCNALFTRLFSLKVISIYKVVYVRLSRGILVKSQRENLAVGITSYGFHSLASPNLLQKRNRLKSNLGITEICL